MFNIGIGLLLGWLIWGYIGLRIRKEADGWFIQYSTSKGIIVKKKLF